MSTSTQRTGTIAPLMFGEFHSPADGISSTTKTVTVMRDGGRQPATDTRPAVQLVTRTNFPGVTFRHFEPVDPCPADRVGYMASGAWVVIDIPTARALGIDPAAYPLHDRSETVAHYATHND